MKEWFEQRTVAIVGNSAGLFDKDHGTEIDSHDVIVRLNKAAMLISKFDAEKSHGKRTDIWMFWRTDEYKKYFPSIDKKIKKMHMGHQDRNRLNYTIIDHVYPNELYDILKTKSGKHNNPTTGLMALDYIISCNPSMISLYGYDWKETPTFTDMTRKKEKECPHDYETEKQYCFQLFNTNKYIFHRK